MDNAPPWWYDRALRIPLYRWYHLNRARVVCSVLPRYPSLLVDVGCNGGTLTRIIAECTGARRVVGLDIKEEFVRYAEVTKRGAVFVVGDALELPLHDCVADVVVLLEVLEHLLNPVKALREAYRVLKPGGLLVVLVPNEDSLVFKVIWWFWSRSFGKAWRDAHVVNFNEEKIVNLIKNTGFKAVYTRKVNLGMLLLITAKRDLSS
ncbi:MAG: methyltransferase domain-containing protein [Candidatus Methanomethylicia archaeon]